MSKQTEALKLALYALDAYRPAIVKRKGLTYSLGDKAITALREALAEQPAQQEPVAWKDKEDKWSEEIAAHHPLKTNAYKQWNTAMAMVGARHSKGALVDLVCWLLQKSSPQRKPMTDAQREEIAKGWRLRNWTVGDIIDAVEAAHGIKENT